MSVSLKRLEQTLSKVISNAPIIPVKTDRGILVGNVLIENIGNLKNLWQYDQIVYSNINLNTSAVKLANVLAKQGKTQKNDELYKLDQDYGRWLIDSQIHYKNYQKSKLNKEFDRSDLFWARYCESKTKCEDFKNKINQLTDLKMNKK
jgi:hypothetical protein